MMRARTILLPVLTIGTSSCLTLDAMLPFHNAVHCSEVTEETCAPTGANDDPYWDPICTVCEEDYDWGKEWGEGGTVRIARNQMDTCGVALEATFPRCPCHKL